LHLSENGSAIAFERGGARVLIGQVQANTAGSCNTNTPAAFHTIQNLLDKAGFALSTIIRQWNYIENILGLEGSKQRYQEFNNVRSEFYGTHFFETGFPAATGIGIKHGSIIIEFVAVNAPEAVSLPIDNPGQVAAHEYSPVVLAGESHLPKSTPKFERARYLELFGQKQLFISGTASIRGEKTTGIGNPEEQTRITIENIQRLYSEERIQQIAGNSVKPEYGHARVYLKNRHDFPVVKKTFQTIYGNLPVVYLIADICRDDLLVEIEGKIILNQD
jgi:enamine deaminase RidA (YjgF/YER057c/UK114 family)